MAHVCVAVPLLFAQQSQSGETPDSRKEVLLQGPHAGHAGPIATNRKCRDLLMLLVFVAAWVGYNGIETGDPERPVNGYFKLLLFNLIWQAVALKKSVVVELWALPRRWRTSDFKRMAIHWAGVLGLVVGFIWLLSRCRGPGDRLKKES